MTDLAQDLEAARDTEYDELLAAYLEEHASESSHFEVNDQASATWCIRKITKARQDLGAVYDLSEAEIAKIAVWRDREAEVHQQTVAFFSALLATWHRKLLAEDPKAKTVKLPGGEMHARKLPDHWEFDAEAFISWANTSGYDPLVRVKFEVDKAEAKKAIALVDGAPYIDGEPVPALTVETGEIKFSVTTGGAE